MILWLVIYPFWLSDTRKVFLSTTSSDLSKINNCYKWCIYYFRLISQSGFKAACSFTCSLMDVLSLWACCFASCNTYPYLASSLACSQDEYIDHQKAGVHWGAHRWYMYEPIVLLSLGILHLLQQAASFRKELADQLFPELWRSEVRPFAQHMCY